MQASDPASAGMLGVNIVNKLLVFMYFLKVSLTPASSYIHQHLGLTILDRVTIVVPEGWRDKDCGMKVTESHTIQVCNS